jgi:hypothetical protein
MIYYYDDRFKKSSPIRFLCFHFVYTTYRREYYGLNWQNLFFSPLFKLYDKGYIKIFEEYTTVYIAFRSYNCLRSEYRYVVGINEHSKDEFSLGRLHTVWINLDSMDKRQCWKCRRF